MDLVSGDEYILRRIPPPKPNMNYVTEKPDKRLRATSAALYIRPSEMGLSCSRLSKTSPKQLLAQIGASSSDGWEVCIWKVSDIPEGLSVVITPSQPPDLDPGHCEIRSKDFSDKLRSKLARASTVLTESEIDLMIPGSIPNLFNS
jgi:hypothetical protein